MENNELRYNGLPVTIKENFLITEFGEIPISEIQEEFDKIQKSLENNTNIIMDFDYLYELEAILEQYKNLY